MSRGKLNDGTNSSLSFQGCQKLEEQYAAGKGRKKHNDKRSKNGTVLYIYVHTTLKLYKRLWRKYCMFLHSQNYRVRTLEDAVAYVQEYINWLMVQPGRWGCTLSAWTVRTYFAAIAKVLGLSAKDYKLPTRHRKDIKRSRNHDPNPENAAPANQDFVKFCQSTGLRKEKELAKLRGSDLIENSDGTYSVLVQQGKGGKKRRAIIWGSTEQVAAVVARMRAAGDDLVWSDIPDIDVHGYRADYALALYLSIARDPMTIPRNERYYCRKDLKGIVFDRVALLTVSRQLGHNRENVVVSNYLYNWKNSLQSSKNGI